MTGEKCWEFLKIDGKWLTIEDAEMEYGMLGAMEKSEKFIEVCLRGDDVDKMVWPDAKKLLIQLVDILKRG